MRRHSSSQAGVGSGTSCQSTCTAMALTLGLAERGQGSDGWCSLIQVAPERPGLPVWRSRGLGHRQWRLPTDWFGRLEPRWFLPVRRDEGRHIVTESITAKWLSSTR